MARIISARLTDEFKQPVIVDNRAGADGVIGADLAAKANADGHVLFIGTAGNLAPPASAAYRIWRASC